MRAGRCRSSVEGMDDQGWRTPGRRRLPFRVPAGVAMALTGPSAAFFLRQPDDGRTAAGNDLAALLGLTIGGVVAVLGLLMVVSGVRAHRRAARVTADGTRATGIVTAAKRLGGEQSSTNWRTTITLDSPVDGVTEATAVGAMPPYTGDAVLVHLDPDDPSYAVVIGFRKAALPETTDPAVLALRAGRPGVYTRRG